MRSVLVFRALARVSNRYRLCKVATHATRKFHRPDIRLQETINDVFIRFQDANPEAEAVNETFVSHSVARRHKVSGVHQAGLPEIFVRSGPEAAGDWRLRKLDRSSFKG